MTATGHFPRRWLNRGRATAGRVIRAGGCAPRRSRDWRPVRSPRPTRDSPTTRGAVAAQRDYRAELVHRLRRVHPELSPAIARVQIQATLMIANDIARIARLRDQAGSTQAVASLCEQILALAIPSYSCAHRGRSPSREDPLSLVRASEGRDLLGQTLKGQGAGALAGSALPGPGGTPPLEPGGRPPGRWAGGRSLGQRTAAATVPAKKSKKFKTAEKLTQDMPKMLS
jgi:hypothetical protein